MSDKVITSGNPIADSFLLRQIADDIMCHAIVRYFEKKGLLDRNEFIDVLNGELAAFAAAKLIVQKEYEAD